MPDLLERLTSALSDRYAIEREIGRGGMAVVFLAHDVRHDRPVALKVFEPELTSSLGAERFLREIRLTARLNHPNILPLHDSGEADGFLYYVMPYVEGESLRERLTREKQLPIEDSIQIARDMCDAVSHAHAQGVVHRDLKPENILLSGGRAVVADFGIARAVSAAGGEKLTQTGLAIGTPTYMSPEQASGEFGIDARSDVYSLGCIVYEMLAGEPPFSGATPQAILARKSIDTVPPLRTVRESVSPTLENAVNKALATVPADRFTEVRHFVEAMESPAAVAHPDPIPWKRWAAAVIGVVLLVAGYLTLSREATPSAGESPENPKLVVLPFENLGSPEDQSFADGLTDEITSRLGRLSGLLVTGRTTAIQYEGTAKTIVQIGEELDVDYVLEGTIRWERGGQGEDQVRVIPQLIRVSDDSHVWTEPYEARVSDVFSIQADIAERVAQALDVHVLDSERRALRERPTDNEEAYLAYVRGNQYPIWGVSVQSDRRRAIALYQRAVDLDPDFADAHARLAVHYSQFPLLYGVTADEAEAALSRAWEHAERAVELNPDLAWGHVAKAYYFHEKYHDAERVRPYLVLAEKADSSSADILQEVGLMYGTALGEFDRALGFALRALELDPLRAESAFAVGFASFALRRHGEAEPAFERAIELNPDEPSYYLFLAWLYLSWQGDTDKAISVMERAAANLGLERAIAGFDWRVSRFLATDARYRQMIESVSLGSPDTDSVNYYMHRATLYDALGERDRARTYYDSALRVEEARPAEGPPWPVRTHHVNLAHVYAGLGDSARAIREMSQGEELVSALWGGRISATQTRAIINARVGDYESALQEVEAILSEPNYWTRKLVAIDPFFLPLHDDPEFARLIGDG